MQGYAMCEIKTWNWNAREVIFCGKNQLAAVLGVDFGNYRRNNHWVYPWLAAELFATYFVEVV